MTCYNYPLERHNYILKDYQLQIPVLIRIAHEKCNTGHRLKNQVSRVSVHDGFIIPVLHIHQYLYIVQENNYRYHHIYLLEQRIYCTVHTGTVPVLLKLLNCYDIHKDHFRYQRIEITLMYGLPHDNMGFPGTYS